MAASIMVKQSTVPDTFVPGWNGLPFRLRERLRRVAANYRRHGMEIFLFGSFARGDNRPNSDLDLGVEWTVKRSGALMVQLREEIDNLPTVRKIDLVDMAEASPELRRLALADRRPITETDE
jgi:uncharacterized protein